MAVEDLFKPGKFMKKSSKRTHKQRYRIARVGKADAFFCIRGILVGEEGTVSKIQGTRGVWLSCDFTFDKLPLPGDSKTVCFHRILLKKLEAPDVQT